VIESVEIYELRGWISYSPWWSVAGLPPSRVFREWDTWNAVGSSIATTPRVSNDELTWVAPLIIVLGYEAE